MAFSAVTARGSATEKVSDTTLAMSPSANLTVGKLVIVSCSTDNIATVDGASSNHSLADTNGNPWIKISEYTETDGAANDGVCTSLFACIIKTQIGTGDSITLTTTSAVTNKIISTFEATVGSGSEFAVEQVGIGQAAIAASVSSLPKREYLLVGSAASEGNDNTKTADADYTERFDLRTGSGTAATEICTHVQTRIATLTSDTCTSTGWTNTNPMTLLAAIYEVPESKIKIPIKPQVPMIEWDDPLTRGLVFDASFFEGGGVSPIDTISRRKGTFNGSPVWKNTQFGRAIDFVAPDTTHAVTFTTGSEVNGLTRNSYEAIIYIRSWGSQSDRLFIKGPGGNNYFSIALESTALKLEISASFNAGANFGYWQVPISVGVFNHVVVTYDGGSTSNDPVVYINGIPVTVTEVGTPSGSRDSDSALIGIGNRSESTFDRSFNGLILYTRYWNRILSAGEARSLYENPWRIYEQPNRYQPLNSAGGGSSYQQNLSESIIIVDGIIRTPSRSLSESLTIVDSLSKITSRSLSEVITIVDTFIKITSHALSEVITIVESFIKTTGKVLSESVSIVDTFERIWTIVRSYSEEIPIIDTLSKVTGRVFSEALTIVDTLVKTPGKVLSETITIVDTIIRSVSRALSEVITLVETLANTTGRALSESITIVDSVIKTTSKIFSESITLVDTIIKTIQREFSESVIVNDTIETLKLYVRELTETITLAETFVRNISRSLSEAIGITDTIESIKVLVRSLDESIAISDTFTRLYNKVLAEQISLTDSISILFNSITGGIQKLLTGELLRSIGGLFPGGIFHKVDQGSGGATTVNQPSGGISDIGDPTGVVGTGDKPEKV